MYIYIYIVLFICYSLIYLFIMCIYIYIYTYVYIEREIDMHRHYTYIGGYVLGRTWTRYAHDLTYMIEDIHAQGWPAGCRDTRTERTDGQRDLPT